MSAAVHDEPLVGEDAFWMTRPIERGSLMAAKVFLLGCGLIILPLLSEITVMTAFSATRAEMVAAVPPLLLQRATWVSPLLAIAVLTRNLTRYVMRQLRAQLPRNAHSSGASGLRAGGGVGNSARH